MSVIDMGRTAVTVDLCVCGIDTAGLGCRRWHMGRGHRQHRGRSVVHCRLLPQPDGGRPDRAESAVDAGSAPADAENIALSNRTTRTDSVGDANIVDMGYHYVAGVTLFKLTGRGARRSG